MQAQAVMSLSPLFYIRENIGFLETISGMIIQMIDDDCFPKTNVSSEINGPQRQKTYIRTSAPSEDSDQTAHSRSLIRIFSGHILDSQGCKVSSYRQRRLRSDYADA